MTGRQWCERKLVRLLLALTLGGGNERACIWACTCCAHAYMHMPTFFSRSAKAAASRSAASSSSRDGALLFFLDPVPCIPTWGLGSGGGGVPTQGNCVTCFLRARQYKVHAYACTYACIYACTYACTYAYTYACTYACMDAHEVVAQTLRSACTGECACGSAGSAQSTQGTHRSRCDGRMALTQTSMPLKAPVPSSCSVSRPVGSRSCAQKQGGAGRWVDEQDARMHACIEAGR